MKNIMLEFNALSSAKGTTTKHLIGGLIFGAAIFLLAQTTPAASVVSAFNYSFRANMTNTGVDTDAKGVVRGSMNRRGATDNQHLTIAVSKLAASATYHLVAFLSDSTNGTAISDFTTSKGGAASVNYLKNRGTPKHPLPTDLDPISNVRELDVVDDAGATVLIADLADPASFSYSLRRAMDNTGFLPGASGILNLRGNLHSTHATIVGKGLTPLTSYQLVINDVGFTTKTATKSGHLTINGPKTGLPLVLDINTVSLNDGTNVVLVTTDLGIPGTLGGTTSQSGVDLGAASSFAVLSGQSVTSTGNTLVDGELGVWPGSSVTGFGPGVVTNGTIHVADTNAQAAQGDLTTAYNDLAGRTLAPVDVANADLGGMTLAPGLYKSTGTLSLTGTVTLDAGGNANAVFIFQVASSLTTASASQVVLSGSAKASNVFWQVGSSASLGTTTLFKGNIIALSDISLANQAQIEGRALARNGSVTMDDNTVSVPSN